MSQEGALDLRPQKARYPLGREALMGVEEAFCTALSYFSYVDQEEGGGGVETVEVVVGEGRGFCGRG